MIEDKNTTEYNVTITVKDEKECANHDPFGLCYVNDCMHCPNALVKIVRKEDNVTMRNDFVHNKNEGFNDYMHDCMYQCKKSMQEDGVDFFETLFKKRLTKTERYMLNKVLDKLIAK